MQEVFSANSNLEEPFTEEFDNFLNSTIPVVIHKTGYEKKFIQELAVGILKTMVTNVRSNTLLQHVTETS